MSETFIRVMTITTEVATKVRQTKKSPQYGHPAHQELAGGYGPCRHCLKVFAIGKDERILFTYNPFQGVDDVPYPGPIYIHAEERERYPETSGYPEHLRKYGSVVSAYGAQQKLLAEEHVDDGSQPSVVERFLIDEAVRYVHVRDKTAGCFDFRIQRLDDAAGEDLQEHKC